MLNELQEYFSVYPQKKAPFLHRQYVNWHISQPLAGLKVLHCAPLVPNTLLQIACLIAAGAGVKVTNPSFMKANVEAINALKKAQITYVEKITSLSSQKFDLYLDCGAEIFQQLGSPKIGAVELTNSGYEFYRKQSLNFPVFNVDDTDTKQLETLLGSGESASKAISQLTQLDVTRKTWLIFGFGKVGRGIAYYCHKNQVPFAVAEIDARIRKIAASFNIQIIDPLNETVLQNVLTKTDIVVAATGKEAIFDSYPKKWFQNKILANMGVLDEFGKQFDKTEVLNNKLPVNFILKDATPIEYIDPILYAHNIAAVELLGSRSFHGVKNLAKEIDQQIVVDWCEFHQRSQTEITKWFVHSNQ